MLSRCHIRQSSDESGLASHQVIEVAPLQHRGLQAAAVAVLQNEPGLQQLYAVLPRLLELPIVLLLCPWRVAQAPAQSASPSALQSASGQIVCSLK